MQQHSGIFTSKDTHCKHSGYAFTLAFLKTGLEGKSAETQGRPRYGCTGGHEMPHPQNSL